MFNPLRNFLKRWFNPGAQGSGISKLMHSVPEEVEFTHEIDHLLPISYDDNLLEQARVQWQFGDWDSLTKLEGGILQHHPDRAKLALLAAAGHIQQGNTQAARQFTRLAQDWGCSKRLVSQILIAGVHNSLGRAAAINRDAQRALRHFEFAIDSGASANETHLLTQARLNEQLIQLGLHAGSLQSFSGISRESISSITHSQQPLLITTLAKHVLVDAMTTNAVVLSRHSIFTHGNCQYMAFYIDEHTLRVAQRDLLVDDIRIHDIHGDYNLRDAYNGISLGIDRAGCLHVSYGHYATQLCYRRAFMPYSVDAWTDELPLIDVNEDWRGFPVFILPHDSHPLTLFYYDGIYTRLKIYDEASQTWTNHQGHINQKTMSGSPCRNHPLVGNDGTLNLILLCRTQAFDKEEWINNINICYARSADNGLTWTASLSCPYRPITQVDEKTVCSVSLNNELISPSSMALDSYNRPHIVFHSDDYNGIPQYQYLWFDGTIWRHRYISQRETAFVQSGETLQIPTINLPEIVIDRQDNVYVVYKDGLTGNKIVVTYLAPPDYFYNSAQTGIVWAAEHGSAELVADRIRWQNENVLTLLVQDYPQSADDLQDKLLDTPILLIDLRFC